MPDTKVCAWRPITHEDLSEPHKVRVVEAFGPCFGSKCVHWCKAHAGRNETNAKPKGSCGLGGGVIIDPAYGDK